MSALIVSDIDGTLIDSRERIPSAVKESLAAAQRAGVSFVVATGRPARWIHPIIDQLYTPPTLCVCANGAVIYDPACDRITRRREMAPMLCVPWCALPARRLAISAVAVWE